MNWKFILSGNIFYDILENKQLKIQTLEKYQNILTALSKSPLE